MKMITLCLILGFAMPLWAGDDPLAECLNGESCAYALRYEAKPSTIALILKGAKANCQQHIGTGATECAILGAYYFKMHKMDLALATLKSDCETNPVGCLLLVAASKQANHPELAKPAVLKFCKNMDKNGPHLVHDNELADDVCPAAKSGADVPEDFNEQADADLRGYLSEQRVEIAP